MLKFDKKSIGNGLDVLKLSENNLKVISPSWSSVFAGVVAIVPLQLQLQATQEK
jgi:hypothetical protein